jgi:hypothetical protein
MKRNTGVKICSEDTTWLLIISIRLHSKLAAAAVHLAEDLRYFCIQMYILKLCHRIWDADFSESSSKQKGNTRNTAVEWRQIHQQSKAQWAPYLTPWHLCSGKEWRWEVQLQPIRDRGDRICPYCCLAFESWVFKTKVSRTVWLSLWAITLIQWQRMDRVSSVGIASRYVLDGPGSGVPKGGGSNPPEIPKLCRIPSSVENTSVTV